LSSKKENENSIANCNSNGITAAGYNTGTIRKDTAMAEMITNYNGKKIVSSSLSRES